MVVTDVLFNILAQFVFFFVSLFIFNFLLTLLSRIFLLLLWKFRWFRYSELIFTGNWSKDNPDAKIFGDC